MPTSSASTGRDDPTTSARALLRLEAARWRAALGNRFVARDRAGRLQVVAWLLALVVGAGGVLLVASRLAAAPGRPAAELPVSVVAQATLLLLLLATEGARRVARPAPDMAWLLTHGVTPRVLALRQVAWGCAVAGLLGWVVPLPLLPWMGDISLGGRVAILGLGIAAYTVGTGMVRATDRPVSWTTRIVPTAEFCAGVVLCWFAFGTPSPGEMRLGSGLLWPWRFVLFTPYGLWTALGMAGLAWWWATRRLVAHYAAWGRVGAAPVVSPALRVHAVVDPGVASGLSRERAVVAALMGRDFRRLRQWRVRDLAVFGYLTIPLLGYFAALPWIDPLNIAPFQHPTLAAVALAGPTVLIVLAIAETLADGTPVLAWATLTRLTSPSLVVTARWMVVGGGAAGYGVCLALLFCAGLVVSGTPATLGVLWMPVLAVSLSSVAAAAHGAATAGLLRAGFPEGLSARVLRYGVVIGPVVGIALLAVRTGSLGVTLVAALVAVLTARAFALHSFRVVEFSLTPSPSSSE